MRQSPRGESAPPETIFGPFGTALRLYWLAKKRVMKSASQLFQCRVIVFFAPRAPGEETGSCWASSHSA
jgi:hypothetical protein